MTGWDRAGVLGRGQEALAAETLDRFFAHVRERARRRPLQHLTGTQPFWRHEFVVTPDVLIPRPETELLVEEGVRAVRGEARPTIVDVGTGSGCIALSLAGECPLATIHAIDISASALAVARENARRLGLEQNVVFHHGSLLEPLEPARGTLDLVVSNPPYVDRSEAPALPPEVRDHEPALALFPAGDRYSLYPRLAKAAFLALRPGGTLAVEVGQGMADEVGRILTNAGFHELRVRDDLQGIPRTVVARRLPPATAG